MSITKYFAYVGGAVGLGFGIFASVNNFNPDAHQSEQMAQATKVFSELLTQIGMAALQSGAFTILAAAAGGLIDFVTCFQFVETKEKEEQYLLDSVSPVQSYSIV